MDTNTGYYNYQGNDNYSRSQSGFAPTPVGNNYSQENNNLYSQNNGINYQQPQIYLPHQIENNYPPPPTNLPTYSPEINEEAYKHYGNQININVDTNVSPININNISPQTNFTPITLTYIEPETTSPLIPPSNKRDNCCNNCCSNCCINISNFCSNGESMTELTNCQRGWTIFFGVILLIITLNNIVISTLIENINHNIFFSMDIPLLCFSIFSCISVLKVKWLRYTATALVIIFLFGVIVVTIIVFYKLDKNNEYKNTHVDEYKFLCVLKIILLFLILHAFFQNYWGIIICKCLYNNCNSGNSPRTHHRRRRHK